MVFSYSSTVEEGDASSDEVLPSPYVLTHVKNTRDSAGLGMYDRTFFKGFSDTGSEVVFDKNATTVSRIKEKAWMLSNLPLEITTTRSGVRKFNREGETKTSWYGVLKCWEADKYCDFAEAIKAGKETESGDESVNDIPMELLNSTEDYGAQTDAAPKYFVKKESTTGSGEEYIEEVKDLCDMGIIDTLTSDENADWIRLRILIQDLRDEINNLPLIRKVFADASFKDKLRTHIANLKKHATSKLGKTAIKMVGKTMVKQLATMIPGGSATYFLAASILPAAVVDGGIDLIASAATGILGGGGKGKTIRRLPRRKTHRGTKRRVSREIYRKSRKSRTYRKRKSRKRKSRTSQKRKSRKRKSQKRKSRKRKSQKRKSRKRKSQKRKYQKRGSRRTIRKRVRGRSRKKTYRGKKTLNKTGNDIYR